MTQPILLIDQVYAIEVPDKIAQVTIDPAFNLLMWWNYEGISNDCQLPPGTWEIICTEATKEQAIEIVDPQVDGWKDYDKDNFHYDLPFMDPLDSLRSLLTSKGLDPVNKNYVLIKKTA